MSPKSGLRHPMAASALADFMPGTRFQELLDDPQVGPRSGGKIKRLLLCSGKVYFDLKAHKDEQKRDDVAIVRLEQLYPLPDEQLNFIFKKYNKTEHVVWVQEEPANMGAWQYIHAMRMNADIHLPKDLELVARKASASPASGFTKVHEQEQKEIISRAFGE